MNDPLIKYRYHFDIVCTFINCWRLSWATNFFKDTTRNLINITRHLLSCRVYIERDISISRAMQLYLMYILNHTHWLYGKHEEEQFFFVSLPLLCVRLDFVINFIFFCFFCTYFHFKISNMQHLAHDVKISVPVRNSSLNHVETW